jgi:NAD(P)-dependent dehydrogenase (short-subunit alcohol dehydrogenase family)
MTTPSDTSPSTARKVALVVGAGDGTGGAIARRFAREGYAACVARRSADRTALVEEIETRIGPIDTAFIRETMPEVYARKADDGILNPEHIANAYWFPARATARCVDV